MMRQVFNDTDTEVLWLIISAPENELEPGQKFDINKFWQPILNNCPKNSPASRGRRKTGKRSRINVLRRHRNFDVSTARGAAAYLLFPSSTCSALMRGSRRSML